jgi:ectoine hydroxylase-related dioxygenase (phytanoyl-CoA dioxygenase family)
MTHRGDANDELRRAALAFEADGRIRDAIDAWTELNKRQPDAAVEEHLVDLRCRPLVDTAADARVDADATPASRCVDDPFPALSGRPPEIDASGLTTELLRGSIAHHGCLLVRGLIERRRAEELRATTDRQFDARERHLRGESSETTAPWYVSCASWDAAAPSKAGALRLFNDRIGAVHVADSPRALFQVVDALESAGVIELVSDYLGERAILSVQKTMLRRVTPQARPAWHQDGSFMGAATRAVNAWVALSDCGEGTNAPGIAILPRRLDRSIRGEVLDAKIVFTPHELESASTGIEPVMPRFEPGDALLFDELLAHANGGAQPGLTRDRYALEAWMFAPRSAPKSYVPILL